MRCLRQLLGGKSDTPSVPVCLCRIEGYIAPSTERTGAQMQQADLDSGAFEMHHGGLKVSPLSVSIRGRERREPSCRLPIRFAALVPFFSTSNHLFPVLPFVLSFSSCNDMDLDHRGRLDCLLLLFDSPMTSYAFHL